MSKYLLDTTALIAHLRGDEAMRRYALGRLRDGHRLATSASNIADRVFPQPGSESEAVPGGGRAARPLGSGAEFTARSGRAPVQTSCVSRRRGLILALNAPPGN